MKWRKILSKMNFWTISVFVITSLIAFSSVNAFSITSAEVSGDGKEESRPAKEKSTITLRCTLTMSTGEEWSVCQWQHVLKGQFDQNNKELNIVCTGLQTDQGKTCSNHGGSHQLDTYANRIRMDVSPNHCGVIISDAKPDDNGVWECTVGAAGQSTQYNSLDLFVSNHSTVRITEPDTWLANPPVIKLDYAQSRPEIRSTCRGYGGRPQPTFNWYINDVRYQINKADYTANPIRVGLDQTYGAYVEETISFTPTYDKLCGRDYGLESVCGSGVFTFNLICKTDQGTFYPTEDRDGASQAVVEVQNGAQLMAGSVLIVLASVLFTSRFS